MSRIEQSIDRSTLYGKALAVTFVSLQRPGLLVGVIALALSAYGASTDLAQFWRSYLLAYIFWGQISLGCLGLVMLHHLAGGRWSARVRRLMETGAMTLPLLALLFAPLLFGLRVLYPWANPETVLHSELLRQKSPYLNVSFFLGRAVLYFVIWLGLAYLLHRWSLEQDRTGDPALAARLRHLSAPGMILYVLTATFAAYDWMMSLEPQWFSSIFGLLFLAGQGLAALALAILGLSVLVREAGTGQEWRGSFNDLGNLLLGFVMIWAYFSFSQFLVIWSANIPEEAVWYVHRGQGGWLQVGMVLITLHFVLPFVLLLVRRVKRTVRWLTALAVLVLFARLIDLFWLITPAFYPDGVHLHWLDAALLIGMGGIWLALFARQWRGKSPFARHDPRL